MARREQPGRERIILALVEALQEKDVKDVTVKELLRRSGANRSTYYYHFRKVDDVVDALMDEFVSSFQESFSVLHRPDSTIEEAKDDVSAASISYVWGHQDAFRALLRGSRGSEFRQLIRATIYKEYLQYDFEWRDVKGGVVTLTPRELHMHLRAVAGATVSILEFLAENGFDETPEEVVALMIKFMGMTGPGGSMTYRG